MSMRTTVNILDKISAMQYNLTRHKSVLILCHLQSVVREGAGGNGVSPISSVGSSGTLGPATDGAMDGPNSTS